MGCLRAERSGVLKASIDSERSNTMPQHLLDAIANVISLLTTYVNSHGLQAAIDAVNRVLG